MREIKSFIHIFSFGDLLLFYHPCAAVCFFFTLATVAADWRMMLLLREPLRQAPREEEREGGRETRRERLRRSRGSPGRSSRDG